MSLLKVLGQRVQTRASATADPWLASLRAGHAAVIEEALTELQPRVRGWVYRRVGPDAAVDDVAQEVLSEIARALPSFEGQSSLATYAYRICSRVVMRQLRRSRARSETPAGAAIEDHASTSAGDPERTAIARQALRRVLACLDRLPARCREAFILCELEGASPQEAAELIGTTPNAIHSRMMRARRELERRLSGRGAKSSGGEA
jgi:RNA polymerase sigma-70 factor (ECF subfamily)